MLNKLFVTMGGGVANNRYKNKGFTLAELLAVITILGIIALIVFPAVNKTVKTSKEKSYNQQVESILRSAKNWGLENISNLREERTNYVTIDELKQSGYLEAKNVVNPMTEEEMNGCIVIKYNSAYNQYEYNYNETSCDELRVLPVITLTGESTITIGIGETYNELGATASFEDIDVSSSITITDNIDNSKVGAYQVRYNVTYDGIEAKEVVRTVKVIDKSPVITLKGNSSITIGLNQTYTDAGAIAKTYDGTDITNSIVVTNDVDTTKAGTYTVRYNVTHDGIEAKEVIRTVTVVNMNPTIVLSPNETDKYEKSITINVTVTPYKDNTISTLTYKLNGGSEQTVSNNQITINTEGNHTIEVTAIDNKGNSETITSGIYKIDTTSPTITFEEGDNVGIELKVTEVTSFDMLTGVTINDNNTINNENISISSDISATEGEYTITYTVTDEAGHTTTKTRKVTVVEAEGPIVSLSMLNTNDKYVGVQSITLTANDTSGVKNLSYQITKDGQALDTVNVTVDGSNHAEDTIELSESGIYSIHVISTDVHNNETILDSGTYYIDVDDPTISLSVSGDPLNESGWSTTDVTLNVATSDTGGSENISYLYCYGNNCTPNTTGSGNTIIISNEGENNYVCAISIDEALNESEKVCVGPYSIDKTISEPTITVASQANSNGWYKEDIGINFTTGTDVSGISSIKYCKTSDSTTCTPDTSMSGTSGSVTIDTESATNYICALSIDNAGNESTSTCSGPYALDKTGPELTVPADTVIITEDVASYNLLTGASATDSLSDIDGSITTSGSLSAAAGNYTITYSVSDKAGNTSSNTREITVLETTTWTYTSDGTFTVPATGTYTIEMHGGGGGGGGGAKAINNINNGYGANGGAGGGSGEIYTATLTKGESYDITIGAGGTGGTKAYKYTQISSATSSSASAGSTGGSTSFGDLYILSGGEGGTGGYAYAKNTGGTGSSSKGSAGDAVGSLASGSSGGSTNGSYGNGGSGGSGGGSGYTSNFATTNGGGGSDGAVIITWVDPTATATLSIDANGGGTSTTTYSRNSSDVLPYGEFTQGEIIDLSGSADYLSRDGYVLLGFNTDPSATNGGYEFVMQSEDVTLYAIWTEVQ